MPAVQKLCVVCGDDVSAKKRVKDARGQYYCEPCQQKRLAQQGAPAARATAAPVLAAAAVAAPADDGMLDLAPVRDAAPARDVPMAACSQCRKVLPEKQVRNVDGEFICNACFSKQNAGKGGRLAAAGKPKMAKSAVVEEEVRGSDGAGFADSLMGGGMVSMGLLVVAFFLRFGLYTLMPDKGSTTAEHLALSAGITVFIGVSSVLLLVSMVVAAHIMGGISFGFLGSALYKSVLFYIGLTTLDFFVDRFESLGMISFGFRFVLIGAAFMLLFKIDAFESFLLAVVNTALYWVLGIALFMLLMGATRSGDSDDMPDRGPRHKPAMVAPDDGGAPKQEGPDGQVPPDAQNKPAELPVGGGG